MNYLESVCALDVSFDDSISMLKLYDESVNMKEINNIITEAGTNVNRQNIFRKIWEAIKKFCKWIKERIINIGKGLKRLITKNGNKNKPIKSITQCIGEAKNSNSKNKSKTIDSSSNNNVYEDFEQYKAKPITEPIYDQIESMINITCDDKTFTIYPGNVKMSDDVVIGILNIIDVIKDEDKYINLLDSLNSKELANDPKQLSEVIDKFNAVINAPITKDRVDNFKNNSKGIPVLLSKWQMFESSFDAIYSFIDAIVGLIDKNNNPKYAEIGNKILKRVKDMSTALNELSKALLTMHTIKPSDFGSIKTLDDLGSFVSILLIEGYPSNSVAINAYLAGMGSLFPEEKPEKVFMQGSCATLDKQRVGIKLADGSSVVFWTSLSALLIACKQLGLITNADIIASSDSSPVINDNTPYVLKFIK